MFKHPAAVLHAIPILAAPAGYARAAAAGALDRQVPDCRGADGAPTKNRDKAEANFREISTPLPVATFGAYTGRAFAERPDRNGLLTCVAQGGPARLDLSWVFPGGGTIPISSIVPEGVTPGYSPFRILEGGIAMQIGDGPARVLLSRASPAARVHVPGRRLLLRTRATQALSVVDGHVQARQRGSSAWTPSEPWIVLFDHQHEEDFAALFTVTARVKRVEWNEDGLLLDFEDPGAAHLMPLEGIRRRRGGAAPIDLMAARARSWVQPLLAFPSGLVEKSQIRRDRVVITLDFQHESLHDAYGNEPEPLAPLPPTVALSAMGDYPVELPQGLVTTSTARNIPTFWGPYWFVPGAHASYSIPLAEGARGLPQPERSREAWAAPIRAELARIVATMGDLDPTFVDNNLRQVRFLGDALPELDEAERAKARQFAEAALGTALEPMFEALEPLTGQKWWTVAKTWRFYFEEDAPAWARDQERFDSEYYNGQALSAILAAVRLDPALLSKALGDVRRLYAYNQMFWDWATGSVWTHATGVSANIDGVQFAFEGMIAAGILGRQADDRALEEDALGRAAKQQTALYAMWQLATWSKEHDYAIGHVSRTRIPPAEVETIGPVDALVEEHGVATLEFRSFWQTTNFLFYANRPLFAFYQRYGLLPRIRTIMYEIMPRLHPHWLDGNAVDPHGENGQERYGTAWTATHLFARAALFGDDPRPLLEIYEATKMTPAAGVWYTIHTPAVAGPLMLALLEGRPGA